MNGAARSLPGPLKAAAGALLLSLLLLTAYPVSAQDTAEGGAASDSGVVAEPGAAADPGVVAEPGAAADPGAVEEPGGEADTAVTLSIREQEIIELDIKTSTLSELAAWCRSLGLSEGGDRDALGNRIREYYRIAQAVAAAGGLSLEVEGAAGPKIITIESARSTEYFTLEVVDEEYARLRGDVVISLKDGDSIHRITAWELLYNRSRNLLSASGGVEYIKESGDTIETFRGESITVDLDNWSSVFMDGVSERSLSGEETTYRFSGNIISRSAEEATVLSRATISNATNEEALWSLSASKIWLLPGSDFAILNGFLKVGEIPVLYIPAFFFPADEMIFHPVLGYRSREGSFFQTTTYILGRPQASASAESSSISKILGNSTDMEKTRHGIFLRSTGKKSRDPNTTRLSVLLDAYANLGFYAGTELALPKKGIFNDYKLSLGLGFTRDVVKMENNNVYTPFPQYDGTDEWNSSYLWGLEAPFRFRMTNAGSLGGKYGTFTWSLPFYSDQFVDRDFLDRSEEMDYVKMLKNDSSELETETNLAKNILGSYEWRLSGSSTLSLPVLAPYVTSLSVSQLSSFITFNYRDSTRYRTAQNTYSPGRTFYYPDKFTIYSVTASISGTPLSLGSAQSSGSQTASGTGSGANAESEPDLFKGLGVPIAPWEEADTTAVASRSGSDPNALIPPVISQRFDLPRSGGLRFSIAYQLSPTSATELKFDSTADSATQHWDESENVDWSQFSSILFNAKTDGSATFSLSDTNNLVSTTLKFTGSGSLQDYAYINEDSAEYKTPAMVNAAKIRAMTATSFTTSSEFTATVRPFYLSPVWSNTNLQYSVKGLIAKSVLEDTANNDPDEAWQDITWGKWDRDNLESHRLAANLQASVMNKAQSLAITAEMPPEETSLTGDATMRVWISETSFSGKIRDPYEDPIYDPLRVTETLRFTNSFSVSQNIVYDPEKEEFTSMTSNLTFYGLTASLTSSYAATYTLSQDDPNNSSSPWRWNSGAESFEPQRFTMGYVQTFRKDELWQKRLSYSLGLNTSLTFDLQRFTNSSLNFTLNFTLGISKFLDITLGTTSSNASMYRYFRDWGIFNVPDSLPVMGESNIFTDLLNSFRFDDEKLRQDSGFKLKSFKLSLLHHLGDWNAKLDVALSPYLTETTPREYKFNTEISFVVQWLPISEIKTEIVRNKDKFEFK